MSGTKTLINVVISIVVIAAVFLGYRLFVKPKLSAPESAGIEAAGYLDGTGGTEETDEFLTLLRDLEAIKFENKEVLAPLASLVDFSKPLAPQAPGRLNPFAPIGSGGAPIRSSAAGSGQAPASTTTASTSTRAN